MFGINPAQLKRDWLERDDPGMRRRRGIVVLSLLGAASLGLATLRQTGIVRHLPDPPARPRFVEP